MKKDDFPPPVQTNSLQDSSTQDVANESANDDKTVDPVDLSVYTSVVSEERSSVPGVRFVNSKGQEEWSPVVKRIEKVEATKGDGSRNNPVRDGDNVEPRLSFAKDIRFMKLDGSPGLLYQKGKTIQSYRWMPITVHSPILSRIRIKTKTIIK